MSSPSATVVKSQAAATPQKPLHNFRFPADLKWAMKHTTTNTKRSRKPPQNETVCAPHKHKLKRTLSQNDDDTNTNTNNNNKSLVLKTGDEIEKLAERKPVGDDVAEKLVKKPGAEVGAGDGSRSKLIIRLKTKSNKVADDQVVNAGGDPPNAAVPDDDPDDLPLRMTCKIRPTRLIDNNNNNVNEGGALKIGGGAALEEIIAPKKKEEEEEKEKGKETDKEKDADKDKEREKETVKDKDEEKEKMKKERMNFSISLKQEEIEDDFFALTGTKPPRRPKKRAKNVQKQLDNVFPGLWLASTAPDSYKVNDGTKKIKV